MSQKYYVRLGDPVFYFLSLGYLIYELNLSWWPFILFLLFGTLINALCYIAAHTN